MTAIALIHRDAILEQVRSGKVLREIAEQYGIRKQSIHAALHNDPEYRAALPIQAAAMIDESKEELWAAREPHDIARAREMARFAIRYAESVDPQRWAPRSQVTVEHVGDLGERLRRAKERVIGSGSAVAALPVVSAELSTASDADDST